MENYLHECSFAFLPAAIISWHEEHANSILTGWWQFKPQIFGYLKEKKKYVKNTKNS